ncbi:hypothetical protein STCU_00002 [Strigomonas culicis]|nr:hypothetical protein STCU_00002 [Strigomonas culicis]|eukprot:EPY37295.1 hypothetical protein STCU_00002 [Strigomonas culicis]
MHASSSVHRRGQSYRRKSLSEEDVYVHLSDKIAMLNQQSQLLLQQESQRVRKEDEYKSTLLATVEEANKRMRELRLEVQQFLREVVNDEEEDDGGAAAATDPTEPHGFRVSAEELQRYMERRYKTQENYYDKLLTQTTMEEKRIATIQQHVRQRQAAGSSFQPVDFDQLHIENEQLAERMEKKNNELAALKNISTRTVQTLNTLTNDLNMLTTEQTRLRKDNKSRQEYLHKCQEEIVVVEQEATRTEKRFHAIKAQQEAMEVPKVEEYIAQKAELFELEKAVKNWTRKVDIAGGQVKVLQQQTRQLTKEQNAALDYAAQRKKKPARAAATAPSRPKPKSKDINNNSTVVGSTKSLLDRKRQGSPPPQ